jgi:hypothetical protein
MDTLAETNEEVHLREEKRNAEFIFGGSLAEGLVAIGAIVVAILALVGTFPLLLLSIAVIAVGAALLSEGAAITARFRNLLHEYTNDRFSIAELGIGTTVESVGGVAAIALGILALLHLNPFILIPAAIITVGATLIFGSGANARLNAIRLPYAERHPIVAEISRETVLAATGIQLLVGTGAVTLGILALCGIFPMLLSLIAVLAVASAILFSGSSLAGRALEMLRP